MRRLFGGEHREDLYKALGVSREAGEKEIKAAFHRLTKLYHPDINPEYEVGWNDMRTSINR